jgi:hypothetical protein
MRQHQRHARPPKTMSKDLEKIFDLVAKLPRRYKTALVVCDMENDQFNALAFSCCRRCAMQAMMIAHVLLSTEIEEEQADSVSATFH